MSDTLPPLSPEQLAFLEKANFSKAPLIPAVVQSVGGKVLMVAFLNREALELSLRSGETHFYSRSRDEIWHKGVTSGNRQKILDMALDCDADTVLFTVSVLGPACHTGSDSCFDGGSLA